MNMNHHIPAMDFIVFLALAFAAAAVIAWSLSPGLRARMERPKHRFLKDVQNFEERSRK